MSHIGVEEIKSGILTKNGRTYLCTCGTEAIVFEFPEDNLDGHDFCEIAIWERYSSSPSLWYRLRYCWRILRYGHPYTDGVCLTKSQIKKLNKYLTNEIEK